VQRNYAEGDLIHEVFSRHARRDPRATALIHRGEAVSYGELDRASDEFAVRFQSSGVGPGDVVPVLIPRTPRLVAFLLAVLKRGAAYAAFDPEWPTDRIEELLRQIRPRVFVTDRRAADWSVPTWNVQDASPAEAAGAGRKPDAVAVRGDSPASVFFTSGTTGAPKGVLSPHRGVIRLFEPCAFAALGTDAVVPQAAPLPWDAFSLELWGALLSGGTSVLVEEPYLLPRTLRSLIRAHGVNVVWLTSSLFNMFVDEDIACFAGLRDLLIGGEKLSPSHVRRFLTSHGDDIRLTNGYGPAESTVFATTHRVTPPDCDDPGGIPLGAPVANTTIHVLDGDRPCGVGEVGELYIAGDGLAVGYLGDPELTRRRFPTITVDGAPRRVYRTGDLAHLSAERLLYFHGRADRQVKIHGRRIEPAEIEQVALRVDGVRQSAVVAAPGTDGSPDRLLLFVVGETGYPEPGRVARYLRRILPEYLVPAEIRAVAEFPLTRNGKLDHEALLGLSEPAREQADHAGSLVPAEFAVVADAFADVLGRSRVPIDSSFFALGGTSLGAARLCVRLSARLGMNIAVVDIMANPSVEALSKWIACAPEAPLLPGPVIEESSDAAIPLIGMQVGFFHAQMFDPDDLSGLCLLTWRIDGPVDPQAVEAAFHDVVARHEALRSRFEIGMAAVNVVVEDGGQAEFRRLDGGAAERLHSFLARPLDPMQGAVCRAALTRDGAGSYVFGVAVHHIVFDGWSEHLFAGDLAIAYRARRRGTAPAFDTPAPRAREVAETFHARVSATELERQKQFWRTSLADLPDIRIENHERTPIAADDATASLEFDVPAIVMDSWREIAKSLGTTSFVAALSSYAEALGRVTGQSRFGIGVPVARRDAPIFASAVNCLINAVCIPVDGADGPDWRSRVQHVHALVMSAFAAQDVPFHEVVEAAGGPQSDRHPLYQVMFAYQDLDEPELLLDDCVTCFSRPDPPQGVTELLAEFFPKPDGSARIRLVYRRDRVPEAWVMRLRDEYHRILQHGSHRLRTRK
jgi:amino acid adenylation domain-containing protein